MFVWDWGLFQGEGLLLLGGNLLRQGLSNLVWSNRRLLRHVLMHHILLGNILAGHTLLRYILSSHVLLGHILWSILVSNILGGH